MVLFALFILALANSAHSIPRAHSYNRLADTLPDDYDTTSDDERTQELLNHIQNFKNQLAKEWLSTQQANPRIIPSDVGEFIDDGEASDIYIPPQSFVPQAGFDYPDYNGPDTYLAAGLPADDLAEFETYYPSLFYKKRSEGRPHKKAASEGGFQRLYDTIRHEDQVASTLQRKHGKITNKKVVATTTTTRKPKVVTTTTQSPVFLSPQRRGQNEVPILRPAQPNEQQEESTDNLEKELPRRTARSSSSSSKNHRHHSTRGVVSTESDLTQELKKLKQFSS